MTDTNRRIALQRLLARRRSLQAAYDALIAEPQSYSIQGSVSATNQKMSDIRSELAAIDSQIAALMGSAGIRRSLPDYSGDIG